MDTRTRGRRTDERLDIIRRLWREESVGFSSDFYQPKGAGVPVQRRLTLGSPLDQLDASNSLSPPSTVPGSISSRGSSPSSPVQSCAVSGSPQNTNSKSESWLVSTKSIAIRSSTRGPTSSPRPPDMISNQENADLVYTKKAEVLSISQNAATDPIAYAAITSSRLTVR